MNRFNFKTFHQYFCTVRTYTNNPIYLFPKTDYRHDDILTLLLKLALLSFGVVPLSRLRPLLSGVQGEAHHYLLPDSLPATRESMIPPLCY